MNKNRTLILSFCVFVIAGSCFEAFGQQAAPVPVVPVQSDEIVGVRTSDDRQRAEIEELREELRREIDLRKRQEAMIEALAKKVAGLEGLVARMPPPVSSPSTTAAATAVQVTDGALAKTDKPASDTTRNQTATGNAVESGFGKIRFTGLLQGHFSAGDQGFNDTFRLRRAEFKFTGEIIPKVRWTVMFDLAKALSLNTTTRSISGSTVIGSVNVNQASRIFQEAFITLSYLKRANVSFGQYKIPLSQEGLQSSSTLDTVERALFLSDRSRGGGFGDVRELGIMAFGPLNKDLDYSIGVFNGLGESQNDVDQNERKALVGRLIYKPSFIKGLQIGGSGAYGNGGRTSNPRRDRLGAELVYEREKLKLKSEFMGGVDGEVHRRGFYAHLGYRIIPKLEGIFRFDTFDPDTRREDASATVAERDYIFGMNYYFKGNNFKLQLNYLRKTFGNRISPARNVFTANLQTSW
ncbi:MAG: hypothetical protein IPN69_12505 [Acidobacteria bacterium]|nr:hypothetical protein [Acidobacteriota bacterium]